MNDGGGVAMRFEVCDDWGVHVYSVDSVDEIAVYFKEKTLGDDRPLRFNKKESRLEVLLPGGYWDVFVADIFQAGFVD